MGSAARRRPPLDLAALVGAGVALAALLATWPPADRGGRRPSRVLPELAAGPPRGVELLADGRPPVVLALGPAPRITAPIAAPADRDELAALLGALEYLTPVRAVPRRAGLGLERPPRAVRLALADGATLELVVGDPLPGQDRVWVGRRVGGALEATAYLVAGAAVRAIPASADDLRSRRPACGDVAIADVAIAASDGGGLRIAAGEVELPVGRWPIDPASLAALERDLCAVELVRFGERPAGSPTLTVSVGASGFRAFGPCPPSAGGPAMPATIEVESAVGSGCAAASTVAAVAAWAAAPARVADRRPLAASGDLRRLDLRLDDGGAIGSDDREAIRAWLAALADAVLGPADAGALAPGPPRARIEAVGEGGAFVAAIHRTRDRGLAAVRPREDGPPLVLGLAPAAAALLEPVALRSRDLLAREPSDVGRIAALDRGRAVGELIRGDLLEEWRARGTAVGVDGTAVAAELARLRADAWEAPRARSTHGLGRRTVEFEVAGERHVLAVGSRRCVARLDADPGVFRMAPSLCAGLGRLFGD